MVPARLVATLGVAAAFTVAGGCGDDDGGPTTSQGPTAEELTFCATHIDTETAVRAAFGGGAGPAAEELDALLEQWVERAPAEVQGDVETQVEILRDALESGDTSFLEQGSDYRQANDRVDEFLVRNCPTDVVEVSGVDDAFVGLPAELPANVPLGVVFSNDGEEPHELVLLRMEEGEEPADMLDLPFAEAQRRADASGTSLLREPGGTDHHVVRLEPGRYAAVCFIPAGTTSEDSLGDGPPHAAEGMIGEFTVG